ncbi:APC family permease [Desulfuromonas thiophila]|jgi:APA family basic amino acid/polyamine antiporter|uniref:Amino acid/polyamine/organocation transporter, APC superfamily n=1 Tax=Desulfuromonas thiophila TaxID=57664 RepID=A0A1G6X5T1_9BACT|nr:amino acid permease [Desulfuromonas thiophila]SDD72727.1 amino acid/polyamine/organocation transporter, APC superfamily [Desulfuromonas thiophila]
MSRQRSAGSLRREIGLVSALVLVVANMVGSGVFTTSGFILEQLGSGPALLLCWLVGGLFALAGALCYGELGAMLPRAGGEYAYLQRAFGAAPAFVSGWISLIVGFSAPIAAAAIAFARYLLGGSHPDWLRLIIGERQLLSLSAVTLLACVTVLVFSAVHMHSLRLGQRLQNGLTLFKVLFILVFIGAGLLWGRGDLAHLQLESGSGGGGGGFAVALIFVSFAYSGWNAAAYLGSEIRQPGRNLPLALVAGTLLVMALYLLLNLVYLYALPPAALQGTLEVGTAAATALFGPRAGELFGLAIALGLLSVLSAMIMAGPRVYFAMARDGLFFQRFGRVHATRNTPAAAILFQAVVAIGMILCAAYDSLLIYIGFTLSITAMLTVLGLMWLRHRCPGLERPYRTFAYPFTPLFFIGGNLWIVFYTVISRPLVGLCGLATLALGLLLYGLMRGSLTRQRAALADGSLVAGAED